MGAFLGFVWESIRRSIGASIVGGLLLAMGVNLKQVTAAFIHHPPWWAEAWWAPWLFIFFAAVILAFVFYRQVLVTEREWREKPQPDTKISDAIDYVVNDSRAIIQRAPKPYIATEGPHAGRRIIHEGVEYSDARKLMNARLISGDLSSWGYRQIEGLSAHEHSIREIPTGYWDDMQLDFKTCFYDCEYAQTTKIPRRQPGVHWYKIQVSERQVHRVWPPKSLFARLRDRVCRRTRIVPDSLAATREFLAALRQEDNTFHWVSIIQAISTFCDQTLLVEEQGLAGEWDSCLKVVLSRQQEVQSIMDKYSRGGLENGSEDQLRLTKIQSLQVSEGREYERLQNAHWATWVKLRAQLRERLLTGELVARGFREPHDAGNLPVEIDAAEWNILVIDESRMRINHRVSGELMYSEITIRKA